MLLPLLAIAKSAKQRIAAFEAGVDDFLTHAVRRDEFLVRAHALLRVSAARRQLAAEQLSQEVQQRELIRAAFRRYISPKLADKILSDPQLRDFTFAQTQVRARAAVMFADMRGFTAISEKLNPVEVVALLNEFFALLTELAPTGFAEPLAAEVARQLPTGRQLRFFDIGAGTPDIPPYSPRRVD